MLGSEGCSSVFGVKDVWWSVRTGPEDVARHRFDSRVRQRLGEEEVLCMVLEFEF